MEHGGENVPTKSHWAWKRESFCRNARQELMSTFILTINDIKLELKACGVEINKSSACEDEIWFHIGGQSIKFSKYEYTNVTGLRFGTSTFDPNVIHQPPANSIYSPRIRDNTLLVHTLWDQFKEGCYREPAGDALKVAKVITNFTLNSIIRAGHIDIIPEFTGPAEYEDVERW
ncbi:hypothetical protein PTKIN_Ptkin06aG0119300 [Pterospermum kingtungense]